MSTRLVAGRIDVTAEKIRQWQSQHLGYTENEDGELVFVNSDPTRPAYITGEENMTPEVYERWVSTIQELVEIADEFFGPMVDAPKLSD